MILVIMNTDNSTTMLHQTYFTKQNIILVIMDTDNSTTMLHQTYFTKQNIILVIYFYLICLSFLLLTIFPVSQAPPTVSCWYCQVCCLRAAWNETELFFVSRLFYQNKLWTSRHANILELAANVAICMQTDSKILTNPISQGKYYYTPGGTEYDHRTVTICDIPSLLPSSPHQAHPVMVY